MRLHIDYETRSPVDLTSSGVYVYAENPFTQVILMAWAVDNDPFRVWYIIRGEPIPLELRLALLDPEVTIVAHNASFERVISTVVGLRQGFLPENVWNAIRNPDRWSCTAARAAACGLPRALEKVAAALYLQHQKDMEGAALMKHMCQPCGYAVDLSPIWIEDSHNLERLGKYCEADGYAEREADDLLPELSDFEHEVWCVTERMNDRGVTVDNALLLKLMALVRDATTYLNQRIKLLTNGEVPAVTNPGKIVKWLKTYGINTEDDKIGKWILQGLLEDDTIPDIVREVLVLRRDGGKSSTAKFNSLLKRLNLDSRIRGALLYAGAAATSRWSSRGAQLQNLPRNKIIKDAHKVINAVFDAETNVYTIEKSFGAPMVVASELVRPIFIAPPGHWLARGDYSQIEARVNAWLAGETKILDAFRALDAGTGPDLYIIAAADIYGVHPSTIDKDDPRRQVGKVVILACGFQGGKNALLAMARIYGLKITEEQAQEAVTAWRAANPKIVAFWNDLNNAAIACMKADPNQDFMVRPGIWFRRNSTCLAMHLPSGRYLTYWYPQLEMKERPWIDPLTGEKAKGLSVTYYAEDSQKKIWRRFTAYGGLFCENVVQATARDIMAGALIRLEKRGMKPILTVHDEAVCQLPISEYPTPKLAAEAVRHVMVEPDEWTFGLPIAADASADSRYVKV